MDYCVAGKQQKNARKCQKRSRVSLPFEVPFLSTLSRSSSQRDFVAVSTLRGAQHVACAAQIKNMDLPPLATT